ncbi:1670_t:CDS:2, partial [Cetraspora pellucida]
MLIFGFSNLYTKITLLNTRIDNINDIEQPNVSSSICLSDTEPGPNENFDSDDSFTKQPKNNESTTRHDNNYITNKHNNHIINNDITNEHNCDYITDNMPKIRCLFKINKINGFQQCSHLMGSTDTSTENFISYLVSQHRITEKSHKQQLEQQQSKQINIDAMFTVNDPKRKARRDQKFIAEFDSNYQLPSERHCQKLLTDAFLASKEHLKEMICNNIITCSLTCDLWTRWNHMGYFGDAISLLTATLKPFAEATELLGGSKYATISFMYSVITVIEQGLLLFSKTSNMNFYSANNVFENNVIYDDDDGVQEDYTSNGKQHQININNPQNSMLATLLDPRCKPLSFISEFLKNKTIELLKTKYEESQ